MVEVRRDGADGHTGTSGDLPDPRPGTLPHPLRRHVSASRARRREAESLADPAGRHQRLELTEVVGDRGAWNQRAATSRDGCALPDSGAATLYTSKPGCAAESASATASAPSRASIHRADEVAPVAGARRRAGTSRYFVLGHHAQVNRSAAIEVSGCHRARCKRRSPPRRRPCRARTSLFALVKASSTGSDGGDSSKGKPICRDAGCEHDRAAMPGKMRREQRVERHGDALLWKVAASGTRRCSTFRIAAR